jgi:hypothetical protein
MATKSQNNWNQVELALGTLAIAATIGLWNLFSTPDPSQASGQVSSTAEPPSPPTAQAQPSPSALPLRPVKIIYGAQAPQQQVIQVVIPPTAGPVQAQVARVARPASTGSSRP